MTTVVLDSADLIEAVTTGNIPVPKGIAEDNAAQAAKAGQLAEHWKAIEQGKASPADKPTDKAAEPAKIETTTEPEADDIEGEDGLTPRQKKEFTQSMLKTIAKKHRAQREAEELATSEYNRGKLAEQRATDLAAENTRLKAQLKPADVVAEEAKPPQREQFETDEAYEDARVDYRVDQKLKAQRAEEAKRQEEQQQQEVVQHAAARIERAIELVPDFKEVTESVDLMVPPHIGNYMQRSEMFAELGYHFAIHPDVLEKLTEFTANLRPGSQAFVNGITDSLVELGRIKSTLQPFAPVAKVKSDLKNGVEPSTETGSAPSKPRIQAPIIRPLNGGSAAQVEKDEGEMKSSEVITSWQKKHGVQLTARKRH
jgi:chemotaxis protein histidine kinase CheA